MKTEEIVYGGRKALKLTQNGIEAVVLTDVGPRVVRFGFVGGGNFFHEDTAQLAQKGEGYTMYGGHRLWHSPEDSVRTYDADNEDVTVEKRKDSVVFTARIDPVSQTQKTIEISMTDTGLSIGHTVTNKGLWEIELAAWALTVMNVDGLVAIPQNQRNTGLLANRTLGIWPYTKMRDPRLFWGEKFITIAGDKNAAGPLKIGTLSENAFAASFQHNGLFVKTFGYDEGEVYPDCNNNCESYSCKEFTEVESLSPLLVLAGEESAELTEEWFLFDKVARPAAHDEETIARELAARGFELK